MPATGQKFLGDMLDRLYASLSNGPSLNCRPHASRQRLDFRLLAQLGDEPGGALLARLLSAEKAVKLTVKSLPKPPDPNASEEQLTPEQKAVRRAWQQQQTTLTKLRAIAEDSRTFEQDTGAHVLFVGYPLLHLPPGRSSAGGKGSAKRVLAPIAFIPIDLALSRAQTNLQLGCIGAGSERVVPNTALLAWIARETGQRAAELADDEAGTDPFKEINSIVGYVRQALGLPAAADLGPETSLTDAPRSADEDADETKIYPAAVLGLFPHSNQSLIADMEALLGGEPLQGPGEVFVNVQASGGRKPPEESTSEPARSSGGLRPPLAEALLVAAADPCQTKTVRLARQANILVVHGPPGTGKSQTIANMIGDHLARGERVLLVCDKRVALDVVYYRLDRLGLGQLCAVVHDAQSDQRELYRSVRDQLDGLVEAKATASAPGKLGTASRELAKVHRELSDCFQAVQQRSEADAPSFHELMGTWLDLKAPDTLAVPEAPLTDVALADGLALEKAIREILQRGLSARYAGNPWTPAAGIGLTDFLGQTMSHWKAVLASLTKAAGELDATDDPAIPPFPAEGEGDGDVPAIAATRAAFGETLGQIWQTVEQPCIQHWAKQDARRIEAALMAFDGQTAFLAAFQQGPLDAELFAVQREGPLKSAQITAWLATLESYLASASLWYGFLCFQRKSAAAQVLRHFGLTLSAANASRVRTFLIGVRARNTLTDWHDTALAPTPLANRHNDALLQRALDDARAVLTALQRLRTEPALQPLTDTVLSAMLEPSQRAALLQGLQLGPSRAKAIAPIETKLAETRLFTAGWLADTSQRIRQGQPLAPLVRDLTEQLSSLEGIVRIRQALGQLPGGVATAVAALLAEEPEVEDGWNAFHKAVVHAEIARRIKNAPALQAVDGEKLQSLFERYRELDEKKKTLTRDSILTHWVGKQKDRLLAGTGSRLNGLGADLRRRLFLRGERAMRLRQVMKIGAEIEGGDPLFDMRPVWMAGPATVAELFSRKPLFEAVIFDEASQCRLEEALPVLTRGKRVVIAGDPQQLPPTRFFESALVQSEDDTEPDSDQALFESQQAEADDLLSAALNLSVEQSYLDVHYRSRHADLIEFSNRNFYESRLQPIPGHPANRPPHAPLKLHRVNGVYDQRTNAAEAGRVVEIVRELLGRKEPPSVGIACFNIAQRDLILDALDEASAADEAFAERLTESRSRTGSGSFEGLFVRNLENVQGDERDCMIISTTYGPDPTGRFYRRFGPLGRAGGGRRLNVLITRARQEVHLVTSFPPEAYRSLPTVPPGSVPTGGWLLFAYLNYAEQLQGHYDEASRSRERPESAAGSPALSSGGLRPRLAPRLASRLATVDVQPMPSPSQFARALAEELARKHNLSSTVHWGNEGFCVDVALHDPEQPTNVTLGILCDGSRYSKTDDPVEWDVFRTAILEAQGWKLHRLWTPQFARDAESAEQAILALLAGPKGENRGRGASRRK